ncbi:MAG: hypothetical protein PHT13_00325, partial [Methanosarcina sp.]|nr:hypothetical protein [Methanosarcina sp.]
MGFFDKIREIFKPKVNTQQAKIACVATNAEFLISEMHRFNGTNARVPKTSDMKAADHYPTRQQFIDEFGSWRQALVAAGFKAPTDKYSEDDIILKIQQFVKENNRIPLLKEFNETTDIPNSLYKDIFGSWTKAVRAAGY